MFELSQDHEDFRAMVRDFAEREVAPHIASWDRDHHFPVHLIPTMAACDHSRTRRARVSGLNQ